MTSISASESLDNMKDGMGKGIPTDVSTLYTPLSGHLLVSNSSPSYGDEVEIVATYPIAEAEVELSVIASQNGIPVFGQIWTSSGKNSPWTIRVNLVGGEWDSVQPATVIFSLTSGAVPLASVSVQSTPSL